MPTFFVGAKVTSYGMNDGKFGKGVRPELAAEIDSIADASGCELVHVGLKANVLQIFIDREEGVSLADCEQVSKHVSAYLDVVDFGRSRYVLEVSSPGLDRQLYSARDFARFVGSLARVTYTTPEGKKRTVTARLTAFEPAPAPGRVTLAEQPSGVELVLGLADIQLARLEIEL